MVLVNYTSPLVESSTCKSSLFPQIRAQVTVHGNQVTICDCSFLTAPDFSTGKLIFNLSVESCLLLIFMYGMFE